MKKAYLHGSILPLLWSTTAAMTKLLGSLDSVQTMKVCTLLMPLFVSGQSDQDWHSYMEPPQSCPIWPTSHRSCP